MSSISGLSSSYQQMQSLQTQEANTEKYLETSQAIMSAMTSSLTSLSQGEAALAEKRVLERAESGSSKTSLSLLVAQLAKSTSENALLGVLDSGSSSGSTVNLLT
jgi:hypothetical protein